MKKSAKLLANFLGATKDLTADYVGLAGITDNELNEIAFTVMKRDDRKTTAKMLATKGLSTRDIAQITGWDHATIARDLSVAKATKAVANATKPVKNGPPSPMPTGRNGNAKSKVKSAASCDFDYEHDVEDEGEPGHVTRAHAFTWQVGEAVRLALESALLRPGVTAKEITPDTIAAIRNVIAAWNKLLIRLKHQQRNK
jgi:hypothetical protein